MPLSNFALSSRRRPPPDRHQRSATWQRLAPLVAALALAGCTLTPEYERPALPVAVEWPIAPSGIGVIDESQRALEFDNDEAVPAAAGVGWRQFYHAPELQALIETALENNRDLRIAILNIEAARAQYNIQRSALAPTVGAGATGQRQRVPGDLSPLGEASISSQYQVGVSMPSFEIDLFGRIRSLSDAALAQYLATEEARRNVQITLISQVAEAWFNLYALAAQRRLTEQTLQSRQSSYDLVKARYDAGIGSALDLNQAETLLDSARSNLEVIQRLSLRARNALTQLTGVPAPVIPDDETLLRNAPLLAEIPADLPSTVLLARPDVLAAEQELIAANANIGAARAAFFPNISLTALFGTASAQLSGLFGGGSTLWNFAPQISVPIFSGGALRGQLELAEVRRDIAVANYERTIQQAFREVSDALAGTATYGKQIQAESDLVAAAKRSLDLAQLRYDSGVDSYLQVHDAERTLYMAQQDLVQSRLEELQNRVALYKALGGGWLAETEGPAPRVVEAPGPGMAEMVREVDSPTGSMPAPGTPEASQEDTTAPQPEPAPAPSTVVPVDTTHGQASASQASSAANDTTTGASTPSQQAPRGPTPASESSTALPQRDTPPNTASPAASDNIMTIEHSTWRNTISGHR